MFAIEHHLPMAHAFGIWRSFRVRPRRWRRYAQIARKIFWHDVRMNVNAATALDGVCVLHQFA
jgi:hypothetical protein